MHPYMSFVHPKMNFVHTVKTTVVDYQQFLQCFVNAECADSEMSD